MILLSTYSEILDLSFSYILQALAVLIVIWEIWKKIKEMKKESDDEYARKESWDKAAQAIKEKEKIWDEAVADIHGERKFIVDRYDTKLKEIEHKIEDNHTDTDAKIQEVRADVMVLAESIRAVLEGLIEQGCNGPVKAAKEKLDHYLIESLGR